MTSYTISNTNMSKKDLMELYSQAKSEFDYDFQDLDIIFNVALNTKYFPNIKMSKHTSEKLYLEKWVKGYYDAQTKGYDAQTKGYRQVNDAPA